MKIRHTGDFVANRNSKLVGVNQWLHTTIPVFVQGQARFQAPTRLSIPSETDLGEAPAAVQHDCGALRGRIRRRDAGRLHGSSILGFRSISLIVVLMHFLRYTLQLADYHNLQ